MTTTAEEKKQRRRESQRRYDKYRRSTKIPKGTEIALARARASKWQKNNPDKVKERNARWRKNNRAKVNEIAARRRMLKRHAGASVLKFYEEAVRMTLETGVPYEVDHIVPIHGRNVSGLHVPWNLQVITRSDNRKKSKTVQL